jgi:hypothetical protein
VALRLPPANVCDRFAVIAVYRSGNATVTQRGASTAAPRRFALGYHVIAPAGREDLPGRADGAFTRADAGTTSFPGYDSPICEPDPPAVHGYDAGATRLEAIAGPGA